MQFHPLAYMVKLKIEMSMAELIAKVARHQQSGHVSTSTNTFRTTERGDENFARKAMNSSNLTKSRVSAKAQAVVASGDDDGSSIELEEVSKGNTTDSSAHESANDLNRYSGPGSSNNPRAIPAIYTSHEVSINVQPATDGNGEGSFDERSGRDDDTRPLRFIGATHTHTNIWSSTDRRYSLERCST